MNCPQCGEVCRCSAESSTTASARWIAETDGASSLSIRSASAVIGTDNQFVNHKGSDLSEQKFASSAQSANPTALVDLWEIEAAEVAEDGLQQSGKAGNLNDNTSSGEDGPAWRDEVATRLNRYRSRRKPRPPRYPSLRLRFEPQQSFRDFTQSSSDPFPVAPPAFDNVSHRALALDRSAVAEPTAARTEGAVIQSLPPGAASSSPLSNSALDYSGAKIIEFPRSATSEFSPPMDELAEPVMERPRILEAPEIAPAPALGGITIETVQQKEIEKRPGIDIPLQSAPLARRIAAAALDGLIIAVGSILFAAVFWKITAIQPPRFQVLELAVGILGVLWGAYQYLLIVYSGSTPGLRLAGLELARFDGTQPNRRRRRWRVLASYLSALSLGMGYAWLFLDEDALCWHDRITHTYLAPKKRQLRT